jgi:hypothetical protein
MILCRSMRRAWQKRLSFNQFYDCSTAVGLKSAMGRACDQGMTPFGSRETLFLSHRVCDSPVRGCAESSLHNPGCEAVEARPHKHEQLIPDAGGLALAPGLRPSAFPPLGVQPTALPGGPRGPHWPWRPTFKPLLPPSAEGRQHKLQHDPQG